MAAPSTSDLVDRLLTGDRRAVARGLTWIEDGSRQRLREVVARIHPHTGRAHLVGVTGSPGVGKSTLVSALIAELRRRERSVAVVAVDPSSPFSGGALLGDRVRMQDHVLDQGVFIRSMASRGHLGGLSWAAPQAVGVLDAAGFDVVVIETVGVGQAEVEVASVADTTVVALAPGMGDAIQAAKAGILEVADVFVVNKADRDGAERTVREIRGMLALGDHDEHSWLPPVLRTVASKAEGLEELADLLGQHRGWLEDSGGRERKQRQRARMTVRELAFDAVRQRFLAVEAGELVERLVQQVAARQLDPYAAADQLVATLG